MIKVILISVKRNKNSIELRIKEVINISIQDKVHHYYLTTNKSPSDIAFLLGISEEEVLICAKNFKKQLIKKEKINSEKNISRRTWTQTEMFFLKKFQNELTVKEASLILRRSRYGTYLKIRQLGLRNMIE